MRSKPKYCGQLQNHVRITNFRGESRELPSLKIFVFLHGLTTWLVMQWSVWSDICELANKTTQQLYKLSTPCIDDHHFKEEDMKSVGELSHVCSQIVLKCLYLARMEDLTILICDGVALPHAILRLNLAGRHFTVCGFLSRPPLRGRSVVMSKWNFAIVILTATQSFNRQCSQMVTSSLSETNVSVARVFFKPSDIGNEPSEVFKFVWTTSDSGVGSLLSASHHVFDDPLFATLALRVFKLWLVRLAENRIVQ